MVDFSVASLSVEDISNADLHQLSRELKVAFMEVGFVFLKNTGITQEEVRLNRNSNCNNNNKSDHLKNGEAKLHWHSRSAVIFCGRFYAVHDFSQILKLISC